MIHPPRPLRTVVGAVSAICYLATQCAFAYQPEKNFWAQRRKSAQGLTLTRTGPVKTFEASALFPTGSVSSLSPLSSAVWAKTVPAGFLKEHRNLFAALLPSVGSIRKVSLPKSGNPPGPVIVHIQDVHMNQDAQKNIGAVVGSLMKAGLVNLIALEGSTEDINLQPFADSPYRKAAEMTADYLLQENKISGPIHAALTHSGPLPRIVGVDDPAHYQANVQSYLDSVPQREKAQQEWKSLQLEIDNQKRTVYSPELAVFDNAVTRYRDGKISLGEYVELLNKTSGPSSSRLGWESVADFLKAFRIERSLDFKKVELERSQLIEKLTQSLTKAESDELVAHGVAHRSGQLRYGEFYSYLVKLCGKKGIRLTAYPAMDAYVRYLLTADGIDGERLLEEMADLEKESYALLAKTTEEKDLAARARRAWLTSKLLDFCLIPTEWKEYQSGPRSESLWAFEAFYEQAQARDKAMADNVLRAMGPSSTTGQVVLLVTGGFHAAEMTDLLTQRGATVVSLVPKIEKIDTAHGAAYLSVFTQEKSPLEKLAQGEKLFLAANPLTPSLKSTLLPALFAMVVIGLGGTALGLDVNVIFNTMGGVGVLALIQRMGNKVKARLKIGKSAINLDLRNDSNSIQSFYQTPSHILASDRWIILLGAGLLVAGVFLLGASGFNGLTVVGVLSAGISYYQVKNAKGDVLGPLTGYLPTLSPDELKALRWLVAQRLRVSSFFDIETITEIVNKAKLLASDASIRLNAQLGLPEIGGKIQIYSENGLSEAGLHKIYAKFGYPIIDHYSMDQTVQTILLPLSLTANGAAQIVSDVLGALKSEWPDLIVEHQITLGGTYPETVRYLALLRWMTGRHLFEPIKNSFHYPGDAPGIVIKGADIEQASPFHPERKPGERIDFRGRAFVLSSVNDDVLRKDLEADLAFIQLGGLAATKSEIPSAERKEWEKSLAGLFKKLVKQINQAVSELSPLAGERLIGEKSWVADKNKSTWDQTVFPALKDLGDRLTSEREATDGHLSRRWLINAKMRFVDEASSVVKTEEAIEVARGTYNKAGNSGRATGWIGVGVAYGVGWVWGGIKKAFGKMNANTTVRDFAIDFVKENNGRRAAIAEDVISTLVAVSVGLSTLAIVGPSMTLNWKLFFPFYVAIVWPYILFRSHGDKREKLKKIFGISPSKNKAPQLSLFVFGVTIFVSLVFVVLWVQFPLIAEFMIPVFGGASFFVLYAYHKDLNKEMSEQAGGDANSKADMLIPLTILGFLGFSPDFAEAAVRTGQLVNLDSIDTVRELFLDAGELVWGGDDSWEWLLLLISGNSTERNRLFIDEKDIKINFEENISVNGSTYRAVHGIYWKGALLTDTKLSEVSPDEALALILALSGRLDEFSQGNPIYKNGYLNYFTMDSSMELILDQCRWVMNHLATSPGAGDQNVASAVNWLFKNSHTDTPFVLGLFRYLLRTSPQVVSNGAHAIMDHYPLHDAGLQGPVAKLNLRYVSSWRAIRGMMDAMGWSESSLLIGYGGDVSEQKAKAWFPHAAVERDSKPTSKNVPTIEFYDGNTPEPVLGTGDNKWEIPLAYFKGIINPVDAGRLENRRRELNVGDRKIIVIGSPANRSEIERPLYAIKQFPSEKRPLVVVALTPDFSVAGLREMLIGLRVEWRNRDDIPYPDSSMSDVLVVTTSGELLDLYAVSDLAIVGTDRNVMEPASQGKPVVLFDSFNWINNNELRDRLMRAGGARVFHDTDLYRLLEDESERIKLGNWAKAVSDLTRDLAKQRAIEFHVTYAFIRTLVNRGQGLAVKWAPEKINGPPESQESKIVTRRLLSFAALFLICGLFSGWAEAAVRTGQIVSHESIAAVLFSVVAYLVAQVVSLMRLNNSSTRPLQPTDAKALDVEAPPLDNPAPSIEDRADEETRNAFHRFAVGVGIDPITARFAPLRVVKGKAGHFERAILGGRRFVGQAVVNPVNDPNVVRARIVAAPMSHPSSENKSQEAVLPPPVAPVRSVELHEKGMVVDEPNETAMPLEDLLEVGFNDYAVTNNMDRKGERFSKARSITKNQLSQAVYVGARRFVVEALRHYYFSDGKVRSRTEVSVLEDPLYKNWMAERLMKENEERTRARRNLWLPPLISSIRPNNILFLLTGKHSVAGFVIDAVFLLGAAASGAMMGVLLPAFALLHVALEHRKDPGLGVKAGLFSFVVHLVFMLPYAFLDFSGGYYQVGAWAWAVAAVGVHGAYDAFAIGLSDGRDVAKLTRGSLTERMEVLLGRVVSVSESFKGEVLSMSPDLFRRLSNEKKGPLYRIGVKIGAAQYKGRSDLVPVIEMPVSNEEELQSLLSLVEKVRNLNQSNPDQQRFITVTPQGEMTADQVNTALSRLNNGTFVFVKNLSGPILFNDYEKEFGSALAQFGLDPKNMFLILAGRPDISDLESIKSGDPRDSELRKALREVLFAPWPVVSTAVIMEMLNAMSVAAKNA